MRSCDWFCAVYRIIFAVLFSSLFNPTAMGQTGDDLIPQYQPAFSEGQRARFDKTLERARTGDATYANNAGWFFATCEDLKFRDRELALKYGLRGVELSEGKNAGFLDTLAEAYFFNEQYDHAVSMEERALELEPQREEFRKSRARFRAALDAAEAKALKPMASE